MHESLVAVGVVAGVAAVGVIAAIAFAFARCKDTPSCDGSRPRARRRRSLRRRETHLRNHSPPSYGSTTTTPQPQVSQYEERQHDRDVAQRNDIATVKTYKSLRARAENEGQLMARCYRQSQNAYSLSDRARAKTLGDHHALNQKLLDAQASAMIFNKNNQDQPACRVDLHGLKVKEAISYSEEAIAGAIRRGDPEICLIVGRGIHSFGGIAVLRPAIQRHLRKAGFDVRADGNNWGVLIVRLDEPNRIVWVV